MKGWLSGSKTAPFVQDHVVAVLDHPNDLFVLLADKYRTFTVSPDLLSPLSSLLLSSSPFSSLLLSSLLLSSNPQTASSTAAWESALHGSRLPCLRCTMSWPIKIIPELL